MPSLASGSARLFPLFARSLDLSPDFFDDKVRICPSLSSSRLEYVEQPMTQHETRHETRLRYYALSISTTNGAHRRAGRVIGFGAHTE